MREGRRREVVGLGIQAVWPEIWVVRNVWMSTAAMAEYHLASRVWLYARSKAATAFGLVSSGGASGLGMITWER